MRWIMVRRKFSEREVDDDSKNRRDMSFLHLDPLNKITLARGVHPLRYSIPETRWFLEMDDGKA